MTWGWQDVAALAVVAACLAYLLRRAWRAVARTPASGCAIGCGSCPSAAGGRRAAGPILPVESLGRPVPRR